MTRLLALMHLSGLSLASLWAQSSLTIYNHNFAVVRDTVVLTLTPGSNQVRYSGVTAYLEPESVILRDPTSRVQLQILEQNYRADPVSAATLLAQYEGKNIDFLVHNGGTTEIVTGRLVRSGYGAVGLPGQWMPAPSYYDPAMQAGRPTVLGQPIVEVNGKLRFQLPGIPLFPGIPADALLKPTLEWTLHSNAAAKIDAELDYVTGGLLWNADYNVIAPVSGDTLELMGWVTIENRSGKAFENASIKLMAGDVNKLQPRRAGEARGGVIGGVVGGGMPGGVPPVTEKSFDEYHLYTLPRPATLHDQETKQVEFLRVAGVSSRQVYVYDGLKLDLSRYGHMPPPEVFRNEASLGTQTNAKVWTMREFVNTKANKLGIPLPSGRLRFYRRDADQRLEFIGEDQIRHTPQGETVRVFTGAAFDLIGERKRTNFHIDHNRSSSEESFEIRLRNRKTTPVNILVNEHLFRGATWDVFTSSQAFQKRDSQLIEFAVTVPPGEEKVVTYSVRYSW